MIRAAADGRCPGTGSLRMTRIRWGYPLEEGGAQGMSTEVMDRVSAVAHDHGIGMDPAEESHEPDEVRTQKEASRDRAGTPAGPRVTTERRAAPRP